MPEVTNLDEALAAAIEFARESVEGTVTRVSVDAQASGEYPYQVWIAEEDLPWPGIAFGQKQKESRPGNRGSVAGVRSPEERQHG